MESLRKFLRKVLARVRGDDLRTVRKQRSRSFKRSIPPEDVQMISCRSRRNNQGTIIPTTPQKSKSEEVNKAITLRSSEELDERLNTIRAQRRQPRVDLNDYVYVGSLLHVSIAQRAGDPRLPPLSAHFAASNISTFIERLTFSHAAAPGSDHSTPLWPGGELELPAIAPLPPLSFLHHDDVDDFGSQCRGEVNRLSLP